MGSWHHQRHLMQTQRLSVSIAASGAAPEIGDPSTARRQQTGDQPNGGRILKKGQNAETSGFANHLNPRNSPGTLRQRPETERARNGWTQANANEIFNCGPTSQPASILPIAALQAVVIVGQEIKLIVALFWKLSAVKENAHCRSSRWQLLKGAWLPWAIGQSPASQLARAP